MMQLLNLIACVCCSQRPWCFTVGKSTFSQPEPVEIKSRRVSLNHSEVHKKETFNQIYSRKNSVPEIYRIETDRETNNQIYSRKISVPDLAIKRISVDILFQRFLNHLKVSFSKFGGITKLVNDLIKDSEESRQGSKDSLSKLKMKCDCVNSVREKILDLYYEYKNAIINDFDLTADDDFIFDYVSQMVSDMDDFDIDDIGADVISEDLAFDSSKYLHYIVFLVENHKKLGPILEAYQKMYAKRLLVEN